MACTMKLTIWFIAIFQVLVWTCLPAQGADPELVTDFAVPAGVNASTLDGSFFTFTEFREGVVASAGDIASKTATSENFPALEGLGISMFLMSFQPGGVLPPHFHPRGSKMIFVIQGTLEVGFTDSTNKLFKQSLSAGDVFVVPKALVHFMANLEGTSESKVVFAFGSSNPGNIKLPGTLFGSGISRTVLEKSFGVSSAVIEKLEAPRTA